MQVVQQRITTSIYQPAPEMLDHGQDLPGALSGTLQRQEELHGSLCAVLRSSRSYVTAAAVETSRLQCSAERDSQARCPDACRASTCGASHLLSDTTRRLLQL